MALSGNSARVQLAISVLRHGDAKPLEALPHEEELWAFSPSFHVNQLKNRWRRTTGDRLWVVATDALGHENKLMTVGRLSATTLPVMSPEGPPRCSWLKERSFSASSRRLIGGPRGSAARGRRVYVCAVPRFGRRVQETRRGGRHDQANHRASCVSRYEHQSSPPPIPATTRPGPSTTACSTSARR